MTNRRRQLYSGPRQGHESFFHRSAILDLDQGRFSRSSLPPMGDDSGIVEPHSNSAATYPPTSRASALQRLHRAVSTAVVTNDFGLQSLPLVDEETDDDVCPIECSGLSIGDVVEENIRLTSVDTDIEERHIKRSIDKLEKSEKRNTKHERNAGAYTVIAFVNSASGGGMGHELYKSLQSHLGPSFVVDLSSCRPGNMPEDSLLKYAHDPMVRVLACGGDGTCGWIFSSLDKVWAYVLGHQSSEVNRPVHLTNYKDHLPLAIMPLGTGNDLSRQFGWGGKFKRHMQGKSMVSSVQSSNITSLDRWRCIIMPVKALAEEEVSLIPKVLGETHRSSHITGQNNDDENARMDTVAVLNSLMLDDDSAKISRASRNKRMTKCEPLAQLFDGVFCNYFSIGFDATIAYLFHHEREMHPEKFSSLTKNKLIYIQKSPYAMKAPKLRKRVKILVNNEKGQLVKLKIPKSCRAIVSICPFSHDKNKFSLSPPSYSCKFCTTVLSTCSHTCFFFIHVEKCYKLIPNATITSCS